MSWFEIVVEWCRAAVAGFWTLVAQTMDLLRDLGALGSGLAVLGLLILLSGAAWRMQRRLVTHLRDDPETRVKYLRQEIWFFLPIWPLLPFVWLWRGTRWLAERIARLVRRKTAEGTDEKPDAAADRDASPPHLIATLGPSFSLGALITAAVYLVCRVVEPLLAARYDLTPGVSAWQYLLLGHRPELASYLPLGRSPYLAVTLTAFLWLTLWWWTSRVVRWSSWRHLCRNLIGHLEDGSVLPTWRRGFGARRLWRPARVYRTWAVPLVVVAAPLLMWAWSSMGDPGQRVRPSELALVMVLFTGWSLHLGLEGARRDPESTDAEAEAAGAETVPGWPEVVEDLRRRLQVVVPEPFRPPRPVLPPAWNLPLEGDPLLSPLLAEVLPRGSEGLSQLQRRELRRVSHLGHLHLPPPRHVGELGLDAALPGDVLPGSREAEERNRIVLAPEGWGKTTLALLAAVNHVLVHTRSVLILTRDEDQAETIHHRLLRRLRGSGLRWNVRLRRVGDDLVRDLSEGIVPDVVVTSLHRLVVNVLDDHEIHAAFLRNLGLVVVDDVESFAGAVEVHAQLAFRRLTLAARKETGVRQLGERNAPLVLALGAESMHRMSPWVHGLLRIEASTGRYPAGDSEGHHGDGGDGAGDASAEGGHVFYRLRDFRTATGERLDLFAVVESCERLGAPWHYRMCRDGQRRRGRKALPLSREPQSFASEARRAAVVLLDGAFSEIRRELDRLRRVGVEHPTGPCALLTLGDPDEDMALTQRDDSSSLSELVDNLPRPVLRPPTGPSIHAHMSSDLVQTWTEVAEILRAFGNASAHKLRHLAREGLLLTEERTDLPPEAHDYESKVFVRSLAAAVDEDDRSHRPLPKKVSQVELASDRWIAVRDRTDLAELCRVETETADFLFYPGRLFADTQGRYLVVHRASREGGEGSTETEEPARGDVLAEPTLSDDVSSPRFADEVHVLDLGREAASSDSAFTGYPFGGPDPVLLGDQPFHVALARVRVTRQYLATLRLGPVFGEVRQRRIFDAASRRRMGRPRLDTVALAFFPNPRTPAEDEASPLLQLEPARLLAAALRLVLPSLVRGSAESLAVTLRCGPSPQDVSGLPEDEIPMPAESKDFVPEHGPVIQPGGGFFLFDLATGGNGTARALYRDGLESLLRMARLVIERVLYHDRLRELYDHWATVDDPSGRHLPETVRHSNHDPDERLKAARDWDRGVREAALTWLDSRLRPEGTPAVAADSLGRYGSGDEEGEGDLIDIGRCWYTGDALVTDLVWAKHRWRRNPVQEVMLDVAFDRHTADTARFLTFESPLLQRGLDLHRRMLDTEKALPDGTRWGRPRGVWFQPEDEEDAPKISQVSDEERALGFQRRTFALVRHAWPLLGPLVERLQEELLGDANRDEATSRFTVARELTRFVQGMTTLAPDATPGPEGTAWTAVDTLLLRRGDVLSKSLLLALLLRRCGIESGLFVSPATGRAVAGAALSDPTTLASQSFRVRRDEQGRFASDEEAVGDEEVYQRSSSQRARDQQRGLVGWAEEVGLPEPPALWAEAPRNPKRPDAVDLYLPLETVSYGPVVSAWRDRSESWIFLPLNDLWLHLDPSADRNGKDDESKSPIETDGTDEMDEEGETP